MASSALNKASTTFADLIPVVLGYLKYFKLMCLLMILGCLGGAVYFVYSPAVYESRALIDLKIFALPIATDNLDTRRLNRSLLEQLNSRQMLASAAHAMGIAKATASFEELRMKQLRKVSVNMLDNSTLQISVFSENPEIVREFPKALVDHWEKYQSQLRLSFMDVAVQKYKNELDQLRAKIDEKLKQEAGFVKDNAIAEVMIEQNTLAHVPVELLRVQYKLQRYSEVKSTIKSRGESLKPQEELSLLESVKDAALDRNPLGNVMAATGDIKDGLMSSVSAGLARGPQTVVVQPSMLEGLTPWQQLEKDLRKAEQDYAETSRTFLENHPKIIQIKDKIRQLGEQLVAELGVERRKFEVEYQQLEFELKQLQTKMPQYTEATEKLNKLKSDYRLSQDGDVAWSKAYTDLAQRLTSMQFGADKDRVDLQFKGFSLLRDEDPVSPTKSKLAMLALVLGIGLALGVPFGLEQLDDRVKGLEVVERSTGLKGLGIIPNALRSYIEEIDRAPETGHGRPDQVLECYRVLRAHLMLEIPGAPSTSNGAGRVVLLTSARPSEGKSLTSGNLAWSFQSMGAKTLFVDLDFRRGRVHKFFDANPGPGLCQVLTGENSLAEVTRPTKLSNLHYIARGTTINGSSELLCRLGIEELIATWRKTYDWIILDSPPVLGLSETTTLQRVADAVVFVVRADQTPMTDIKAAITQLRKADAKLTGFVLNDVHLERLANHYNYYYYTRYYYESISDA